METSIFKLIEATIEDIQQAFRDQKLTSVELVQAYLDRIEKFDQNGPNINSVRAINPDSLAIAAELDEKRGQTEQGPLYGIPVLLKDNIETKDPMPTTAGAIALEHNFAKDDAFVAKQLRNAGAIILGKVNLSEWAYFMSQDGPSGYSSLAGQVKNPYGIDIFKPEDVGGSSSGRVLRSRRTSRWSASARKLRARSSAHPVPIPSSASSRLSGSSADRASSRSLKARILPDQWHAP